MSMPAQKCKYLKNVKSFQHEIKSIFHHFQSGFVRNCLRSESGLLIYAIISLADNMFSLIPLDISLMYSKSTSLMY